MRITDIQTHLLGIPISQERIKAPWFWGSFNQIIVAIETDEGVTGYGEAFGYGVPEATASVIDKVLKPMLVGEDPTNITAIQNNLYRKTHLFGRYGITTFAISGIDIALWDIAAKFANLPLYRLLGGTDTDKVPAYASLVRYANAGEVRTAVKQALDEGYSAIKLHQLDVESLKAAREISGDAVKLMIDVNCPWSPEQALNMARQFKPYNIEWLEEPIWPPEDFKGLAKLGQKAGVAIGLGENACTVHQFQSMLDAGAADYIQPSVVKVGGITEWRKVAALAETYNVSIAPHSPYFGPGFLASIHLIAATPCADWLEYIYIDLETSVFKDFPSVKDGYFPLPQGPGIGLEIDSEVLRRYK